jgi:hypothetical protein
MPFHLWLILEFTFFFSHHEEMHIWGITNWSFFLHLAISTNQCFFMWHEEMHLFIHAVGKCMGNVSLAIIFYYCKNMLFWLENSIKKDFILDKCQFKNHFVLNKSIWTYPTWLGWFFLQVNYWITWWIILIIGY